jgi:hypothetical protein
VIPPERYDRVDRRPTAGAQAAASDTADATGGAITVTVIAPIALSSR